MKLKSCKLVVDTHSVALGPKQFYISFFYLQYHIEIFIKSVLHHDPFLFKITLHFSNASVATSHFLQVLLLLIIRLNIN